MMNPSDPSLPSLQIEKDADSDWMEVRDEEKGDRWFFNPRTGKSQWDPPACLVGLNLPDERIKVLPASGLKAFEEEVQKQLEKKETESVTSTDPSVSPATSQGGVGLGGGDRKERAAAVASAWLTVFVAPCGWP